MDLLNIFTLNLFIDVLPDGILSVLSNQSKIFNNLIYYDKGSKGSMRKLYKILKETKSYNLKEYLRIIQLQGPYKLNELNLEHDHNITNEKIKAIADSLKFSNLNVLFFRYNILKYVGVKTLVDSLKFSNLKYLGLTSNKIGAKEVKYIMHSLKDSNLTELELSDNNIGYIGAEYIADLLKYTKLTYLGLSNNRIGYKGVKAIADSFKDSNLTSVNLSFNNIGDNGIKVLADSLKDSKLKSLNLYYDFKDIEDETKRYIEHEMMVNKIYNRSNV